jgi:metal-responsive CopG/Arc/MetJ family transcriptional regulator
MAPNSERSQRVCISLSAEEIAAVNDFRFERRMPNRASAMRALLRRGLETSEKTERASGGGNWRSRRVLRLDT